jgi:hypothetical protein
MTKISNAAAFLENMKQEPAEAAAVGVPDKKSQATVKPQVASRFGLKHIGGYLTPDTVEKVAILRARLDLDNSELITLAVEELYRKQAAKKAFSD